MHDKEVLLFSEAAQLLKTGFYVDAINVLESLVRAFPDSDLADDAEYNRALCYYELNFFDKSRDILRSLVEKYPAATISALDNSTEFGRTAAKAYYLMISCCLAMGSSNDAREILPQLEGYPDSYVVVSGKKETYCELSKRAIEVYLSLAAGKTTDNKNV